MAERLGVPIRWLFEQAKAGHVPCLRVGKGFRFNPEAVEQALLERARQVPAGTTDGPPAPDNSGGGGRVA
jgi:excisionase family DNA binding protein